jgi:hypothetical protein
MNDRNFMRHADNVIRNIVNKRAEGLPTESLERHLEDLRVEAGRRGLHVDAVTKKVGSET